MAEFGTTSPETIEKFNQALRDDPQLIGKLLTWAIENEIVLMPDGSSDGVTAEELLEQIDEDEHASQMEDELLDQLRQEELDLEHQEENED